MLQGPGRVEWGRGCLLEKAGEIVKGFGGSVLLVSGENFLDQSGLAEKIIAALKKHSVAVRRFRVSGEPTVHEVDEGRKQAKAVGARSVFAVGGGSALDAGKCIAGLFREKHPAADYHQAREILKPGLPFAAAPTTAGTGSEATPNGVISDPLNLRKASIRHSSMFPDVAFLDADLLKNTPPEVAGPSGMDALVQAVESYLSAKSSPLTEPVSLGAVKMICENLPASVEGDPGAQEKMLAGSFLAGHAMATSRLGVVHGIAHPVGIREKIPHGTVCAILIEHALIFNREGVLEKYTELEKVMGEDPAEKVKALRKQLGIPASLGELGMQSDEFDVIAAESMTSGSLKANPVEVTEGDVKLILKAAL